MYSRFSLFNFSIRPFDEWKVLLGQNKYSPFASREFPLKSGVVFLLQSISLSFIMPKSSFKKRKFLRCKIECFFCAKGMFPFDKQKFLKAEHDNTPLTK